MAIVGAGNRMSALGASQVAQVGVWPAFEGDGFFFWVIAAGGGRWRVHPVEAQAGTALTVTQTLAENYANHVSLYGAKPAYCVIQAGGNDMDGGAPAALAKIATILDTLLAQGILPIITELAPGDDTTQMVAKIRYSIGLSHMANARGIPYVRVPMGIIDEVTGGLAAAYSLEGVGAGVHLNKAGAKLFGEYIAARLLDGSVTMPWEPMLARAGDATSVTAYKLSNPIFLSESGTPGIPTNWSVSSNPDSATTSYALVGGGSEVAGNWFAITKTASTADAILQASLGAVTAGNWYAIGYALKYDYQSGSNGAIYVETRDQTPATVSQDVYFTDSDVTGVVRQWRVIQAPVGSTSLTMRLRMNAVGTLSFGQPTIVDLTAAGIDTWK